MKILAAIGISVLTILSIVVVLWEALLLTVFSTTREFWYAAHAISAAILMLAFGILFRFKARRSLTIGSSLFFSLCAVAILVFHFGEREGYYPQMEFSMPRWHFTVFTYGAMAFGIIPLGMLLLKWPKQSSIASSGQKSAQTL